MQQQYQTKRSNKNDKLYVMKMINIYIPPSTILLSIQPKQKTKTEYRKRRYT